MSSCKSLKVYGELTASYNEFIDLGYTERVIIIFLSESELEENRVQYLNSQIFPS